MEVKRELDVSKRRPMQRNSTIRILRTHKKQKDDPPGSGALTVWDVIAGKSRGNGTTQRQNAGTKVHELRLKRCTFSNKNKKMKKIEKTYYVSRKAVDIIGVSEMMWAFEKVQVSKPEVHAASPMTVHQYVTARMRRTRKRSNPC